MPRPRSHLRCRGRRVRQLGRLQHGDLEGSAAAPGHKHSPLEQLPPQGLHTSPSPCHARHSPRILTELSSTRYGEGTQYRHSCSAVTAGRDWIWGLTLDWAGAFGKGDLNADLSTCSAPTTLSTLGSRAFLLRSKLRRRACHCQNFDAMMRTGSLFCISFKEHLDMSAVDTEQQRRSWLTSH